MNICRLLTVLSVGIWVEPNSQNRIQDLAYIAVLVMQYITLHMSLFIISLISVIHFVIVILLDHNVLLTCTYEKDGKLRNLYHIFK